MYKWLRCSFESNESSCNVGERNGCGGGGFLSAACGVGWHWVASGRWGVVGWLVGRWTQQIARVRLFEPVDCLRCVVSYGVVGGCCLGLFFYGQHSVPHLKFYVVLCCFFFFGVLCSALRARLLSLTKRCVFFQFSSQWELCGRSTMHTCCYTCILHAW